MGRVWRARGDEWLQRCRSGLSSRSHHLAHPLVPSHRAARARRLSTTRRKVDVSDATPRMRMRSAMLKTTAR
eukprot:scaffold69163_cov30-Tisochrysis_lutea.AAC.3